MAVDIDVISKAYFPFETPVPYKLGCGVTIYINPVKLVDSIIFLTSYGILDIDKNSSSDIEDIQMSYLEYLVKKVLIIPQARIQFVYLCSLCLNFTMPNIELDKNKKFILSNIDDKGNKIIVKSKEFDDIRRIILYQNLINYDDEYINPELKKSMKETDELKMANIEQISLERKIAIISSHTGISNKIQMEMTLRQHDRLFNEVCEEIEYSALKAIATFSGKSDEVQWIYKKKKSKYDGYITSVDSYTQSMGGDANMITTSATNISEGLASQFDKFIGG